MRVACLALVAALILPAGAGAQVAALANANPAATAAYWTAARLGGAKPMRLPVGIPPRRDERTAAPVGQPLSFPGQPPTLKALPDYSNALFTPVRRALESPANQPLLVDPGFGLRFTSARMVPDDVAALGAEALFPHALNGQLFFKVPAGAAFPKGHYVCSATVQRRRVITTAGHCVSDGRGTFFKNFVFVPALRNGVGPFGSWTWAFLVVAADWHLGGGGVPNAQDVASIELNDIGGSAVGDFTGTAGAAVSSLVDGQHITVNGYPCNIDICNKMHRNDAQVSAVLFSNTVIGGSDMRGGASGGGWFINWGQYGAGQPPAGVGESFGPGGANLLVGVTSYGPGSPSSFYLGASTLDGRYFNGINGVLDLVCAHRLGNC